MDKENLDQIVWKGDPTGIFFVKSAYMSLSNQPSGYTDDVFNLLWQAKATPKALITTWRILLDRLPTSNNLIKRGMMGISPNKVWKGMWVTIVRCIWEQRNLVVFKQGVSDAEEIFHSAQLSSWLRLKHRMFKVSREAV
ncbi:uncharacterized protein [Phaseolus vulgaris]|uniref:uncharacterized protein n=1 Tax=Phaseolus vulgaris TaxID=3885 RepID=UPI0035CA18BB